MYDNNDIQNMIDTVNKNREAFKPFLDHINFTDQAAINNVLSSGWVETFDRYDSDVCEQFITAYEKYQKSNCFVK